MRLDSGRREADPLHVERGERAEAAEHERTRPRPKESRGARIAPAEAESLRLQQAAGNRAVQRLVSGEITPVAVAPGLVQRNGGKSKPYSGAGESAHYGSSRDDAHRNAKKALLAADSSSEVSKKIYGKHRTKNHGGKCVTSFKTSTGGYLVVVTYADLSSGWLTYDTAFLSKDVASPPETTAITYAPDAPVIAVG
jgi:hypothetical protein